MQLRKLLCLLLPLALLSAREAGATATLNVGAIPLQTAGGANMGVNGIVILVASTNGTTFGGPTATSFVSGGNLEVARWNLSGTATAGEFSDTTGPISVSGGSLVSGQALALYWFPTLNYSTIGTNGPGANTTYGFYRDPVANGVYGAGVDGSDPWYVPSDNATVSIYFVTTAGGGSANATNSLASRTVPSGNTAPVANTDTYTRTSNLSLKIDIASLLTNDTDANTNPITLTGINLTTTNNITLTTNTTDIFYPSNAANVNDKFTYTISDGQGGTATGSVLISIINVTGTNSVLNLQVGVPATGTNTLKFLGVPGFSYISQYATNVTGPWVNYATNTAAANGLWTNLDRFATSPQRFYRAQY